MSSASVPRARLCLSHVSVPHARTFCIKCVSVGQRSLRHMQSAHALGGFSPRARINTSNTPAQMKVRGVTLKQGEKTELEGHASPKKPHAFSIGSLSGITQVTWAGRMWVWGVCVVLSVGWGAQVLTVRPCTQIYSEFFTIGYNTERVPDLRPYCTGKDIGSEKELQKALRTWQSSGFIFYTLASCFVWTTGGFFMCIGIYDFFDIVHILRIWTWPKDSNRQKPRIRHIKNG